MKNSIEEDIELLQDETSSLELFFKCKGSEKYKIALEHILSDYKRVLKENEELKEEKINNYRMIALAQNEALGYMQGYEDGKKHKMTAMTQVVENQQYYIIQKQMEKYEKHIKKLQKENEELNLKYYMLYTGKIENLKAQEVKIKSQVIPVQEVKDKIEEYKNMLKTCNKAKERR